MNKPYLPSKYIPLLIVGVLFLLITSRCSLASQLAASSTVSPIVPIKTASNTIPAASLTPTPLPKVVEGGTTSAPSTPSKTPSKPASTPKKPKITLMPTSIPTLAPTVSPSDLETARSKIKHIIVIMQENRSFDHYFGTFPGADGIPMLNGAPTVCLEDPEKGGCVSPFHDANDVNYGGPHAEDSARKDINAGKMDGFVSVEVAGWKKVCTSSTDPNCSIYAAGRDVMGYHDAREIPNYWTYAQQFVLQDRMFEPNASWSLPAHLFMVSAWSAWCPDHNNPMTCKNVLNDPWPGLKLGVTQNDFAWTDLTYLLYKNNVSWGYYLSEGAEPDCRDDAADCATVVMKATVPGIWNPLPNFKTVLEDNQLSNIQTIDKFFQAAQDGTLPSVAWVIPSWRVSEHPSASVHLGQAYVTRLINSIMQGPDWDSTAIFLAWDDWGGFYDHVVPPTIDNNGYGLRVPGLLISPYARQGLIDHQTLSFDAYLKLVEDIFLNQQRLDPATDGRPDSRPTVRENAPQLGDLLSEFDFSQAPRPPLILPENPKPGPASVP